MVWKDQINAIRLLSSTVRRDIVSLNSSTLTLERHLSDLKTRMQSLNSRIIELQAENLLHSPLKAWQFMMQRQWKKAKLEQVDTLRSEYDSLKTEYEATVLRLRQVNKEISILQQRDEELHNMIKELYRKELSSLDDRRDEDVLDSYAAASVQTAINHPPYNRHI